MGAGRRADGSGAGPRLRPKSVPTRRQPGGSRRRAGPLAAATVQAGQCRGQNLAYLVLEGTAGSRVGAYDLGAKRLLWTQPDEVTTRIAAGATVIVHGSKPPEGSTATAVVTVRDARTGAALWNRILSAKERLYGYDVEGDTVYLVVQPTGARAAATPAGRARARWTDGEPALATHASRWSRRRARRSRWIAGRPGAVAISRAARRRQWGRAGPGALDRRGRLVRARPPGGDVLRVVRHFPPRPLDGPWLAAIAELFARAPARLRAADLLVRPLSSRAVRLFGHRPQPHSLAGDGGRRPGPFSRRSDLRPSLPILFRFRCRLGRAALGLQPPGQRRGGFHGQRAGHPVRHP